MVRKFLLLLLFTAFASSAAAQIQNVRVLDSATGTPVDVGTTANSAIRSDLVGAALTSLQLIDNLPVLEDAVAADGGTGLAAFAKRQDTPAGDTSADGDLSYFKVDSLGRMWVHVAADDVAPTQYQEDAVHTNGDKGFLLLARRADAASSSSTTDGDYSTLNVDALGRLWMNCGTGCSGGTQYVEDNASAGAETGTLSLVIRRDTPTTDTSATGDFATMIVDSTNRLWVNTEIPDAATLGDATTNPTIPAIAAFIMAFNGTTWDRARLATDVVEDVAETGGVAGPAVMSVRRDTPASSSGTSGDYSTFNTNLEGGLWVTSTPSASGGGSVFMASSADGSTALTSTAQTIKGSAGVLLAYFCSNPNAASSYVHIYNATTPTVGTTAPQIMFEFQANQAANMALPYPMQFTTAMTTSATSTAGGNGAPTTALNCWFEYK